MPLASTITLMTNPFRPTSSAGWDTSFARGLCACWQPRYSMARLCGQGSGAMSVHNVDNKRKHRKIRCNSIEYDKGAQW